MLLRYRIPLALTLLVALAASAFPGQEPAEPWGFVYVFRTMQLIPITAPEAQLGRLQENQIVLTSRLVSRRHARFARSDEGVTLEDIGSTNGTRVNGEELNARRPVSLEAGDRVQFADELVLFHTSLNELWAEELRLRLLSSIVKLHLRFPEDEVRKSLGRELLVPATTEVTLDWDAENADVEYSTEVQPTSPFLAEGGGFIGFVELEDGILELSLWAPDAAASMTSRRSAMGRLKHTTVRVAQVGESAPGEGPWYPNSALAQLFEVYPDDPELSLQFAVNLKEQEQSVALRDAATVLAFRDRLNPQGAKLLLLAAAAGAGWVESEASCKRASLTSEEREALAEELRLSQERLDAARAKGASRGDQEEAVAAIRRAEQWLMRLESQAEGR